METTIAQDAFKSRWGYHPCDHSTYRKLKALSKAYWEAVRDFHRWNRWNRKQPENRKGPEPALNKLFVWDEPWYRQTTKADGTTRCVCFPKKLVGHNIPQMLREARTPTAEPQEPWHASQLAEIDRLLASI